MNETLNIQEATANLKMSISDADRSFDELMRTGDEWNDAGWRIEKCFLQLLAIVETMGLSELHKMILSEYLAEKDSKEGFLRQATIPDGEPYSANVSRLRIFLGAIEQFFPHEEPTIISKDLLQIILDTTYFKSIIHIRGRGHVKQRSQD